MPGPDVLLGAAMLGGAVIYAITGGADYGAGVWDLAARGPRQRAQRSLIEHAIGPIWEANHVWLIFVIVVMFSAFPRAFAAMSTALHIPMTLLLLGIVARGASFTFRAYDTRADRVQRRWGMIFSIASIVTPVLLGVLVGSVASGEIRFGERGALETGFFHPWATTAFPWAVGLLTLSLFAYLAAVYLAYAAPTEELASDFRGRALVAAGVAALLAVATFVLARTGAPVVYDGLLDATYALVFFGGTAASAIVAVLSLVRRRYAIARVAAAAQVSLIVLGWGAAQAPWLLAGELSLADASAPAHVQWLIFWAVVAGALPLIAALYYLFRVFRRPAL